jgi:EAL domain-containing protein (putative c-di-GMP-specific phosphodiesterase class I)
MSKSGILNDGKFYIKTWRKRMKMLSYLFLSNRSLKYFTPAFVLRDPVNSLIHQYRKKGEQCAVILFHLEDFDNLVTSYSAARIDSIQAAIREGISQALPQYLKEEEIIGLKQFHDDDFCLFVRAGQSATYDQLTLKAEQLRKSIEIGLANSLRPYTDGYIHFQMGVYRFSQLENDRDTENIVQNAYRYAHAIATKKLPSTFSCSREELKNIIENEDISVLAQPIMDLKNGDIFGWEILTRGPQNTLFHLPTELFNFAYQADLLTKMEFLVMKKTLEEIANRKIKESVFINVTSVSLSHPFFLNNLIEQLALYKDISAKQIIFEITERHSIKDYEHMALIMKKFRSHGFRFAVDDAGSGYASLQTISELIPDIIKIDRSVIQNIDQISMKQTMLKALLFFAENINCQVVAEGVETEAEAEVLYQHKVQMGQGYYFAKPEPLTFNHERNHLFLMRQKIILRQHSGNVTA